MGRRLILDTGVLIASERQRASVSAILDPADDIAIAAISVAELTQGVLQSEVPRRARRKAFIDSILEVIPVLSYDHKVALCHAELLAFVRQQGKPRGAHDLIIAATASASDRTLVTTDGRASFAELPGIEVLLIER